MMTGLCPEAQLEVRTREKFACDFPSVVQRLTANVLRTVFSLKHGDCAGLIRRGSHAKPVERREGKPLVSIDPALSDEAARSRAVADVITDLAAKKIVTGVCNELYPVVAHFGDTPSLLLERAAAPHFGIKAFGVHVNGYCRKVDGLHLWVARRSSHKPTWPGRLDHIAAGGAGGCFHLSLFPVRATLAMLEAERFSCIIAKAQGAFAKASVWTTPFDALLFLLPPMAFLFAALGAWLTLQMIKYWAHLM